LFLLFGGWGETGVWTQGFALTKQELYHLSHTSSPFCSGYFGDRVSQTICLCCLQTVILLISASQVARIIDVSPRHLASFLLTYRISYSHTSQSYKVTQCWLGTILFLKLCWYHNMTVNTSVKSMKQCHSTAH
jgi:hypothetical protein